LLFREKRNDSLGTLFSTVKGGGSGRKGKLTLVDVLKVVDGETSSMILKIVTLRKEVRGVLWVDVAETFQKNGGYIGMWCRPEKGSEKREKVYPNMVHYHHERLRKKKKEKALRVNDCNPV